MRLKHLIVASLLVIAGLASADKTWQGPSTGGDWATGANWSGGTAPVAGDAVTLMGGVTVRLSAATAWLSDFTLSNATVVVTNWNSHLQATNVTIQSGGKMTLYGPFGTSETPSRVSIICTNFTLDRGGVILVDTQGYRAAQGPGAGLASRSQGAGYGGRGGFGDSSVNKATWLTYGSVDAPADPGSGGGVVTAGGSGGGAVWIEASGTATIYGTISANGAAGLYLSASAYGSGGSGGSIYLQCGSLSGGTSGLVRANGGAGSSNAGRGGGGRIAVAYAGTPSPWPAIRFSASVGGSGYNPTHPFAAQWGTLWFPDAAALGIDLTSNVFTDVQIVPGLVTMATVPSFTVVSNTFRIATTNFQLNVSGDLTVGPGANVGLWNLDVGGEILLTNSGLLKIYADATNGVSPDYGALLSVSNALVISTNSWLHLVSEELTGGGPLVRAGQIWIANAGGINADANGFRYTKGPGAGGTGERVEGGGYGGDSGRGSYGYSTDGLAYGSPTGPALCGSGGGGDIPGVHIGGFGGGLVRLETTGSVYVAGTITANGGTYMLGNTAGGSGGGVFIRCDTLSGATSGVIRANGGSSSGSGGKSGGGRICMDYGSAIWPGPRFQTSPGSVGVASTFPYIGKPGSLYLSDFSALGEIVDGSRFVDTVLFVSNQTAWQTGSLTVSNCALLFGAPAFQLVVTNVLTVGTNGSVSASRIYCDSLLLTNAGALTVQAFPTNGTANAEWGGLLAVTNDIEISRSSWLYPVSDPTNGGSVKIETARMRVGDGGGVSALGRGFMGSTGPGFGFGSRRAGGGYGGRGGRGDNAFTTDPYGVTNGSYLAPLWPGSGGCLTGVGGYGGGVIRIEASGKVVLNGTLNASGGKASSTTAGVGYAGGGSGGGVMLLCQELEGDATASILAPGGAMGSAAAGGGGGGRISVAVGMSEANRTLLLGGEIPPSLTLYDAHAGFNGTLSAAPGVGYPHTNAIYLAQTGTYSFLSAGSFILTIAGDPANFGSPSPDSYGSIITIPSDAWVTNSVATPANESNGLRRACLGWTLALTNGSPVDAGASNEAVFQFTNDMVLTWFWTNEFRFILTNGPNGSVNTGDFSPWYTNGTALTAITATPEAGYVFDRWVGDVPAGQETSNPISVVMDQARTLNAAFRMPGGVARTWNGYGNWHDHELWSPAGLPGYEDQVTLGSGTVLVDEAFACAALTVNAGAALVFSNWNNCLTVGGDLLVASGGVVRIAAPYADAGPTNRIWLSCANATIEAGGLITGDGLGYTWGQGPTHAGFGDSSRGAGGSHGGRGGYGSQFQCAPGATYDSLEQPVLAGGGGGSPLGGTGGGAIRIDASGTLQVHGTISANGLVSASNCGGGAGGAVWISCSAFGGSTSGLIRASGGNTSSTAGGGGGGGRIAIHGVLAGEPSVTLQTRAGIGGYGDLFVEPTLFQLRADQGTVYVTDPNWLTPDLTGGRFTEVTLTVSNKTTWAVDHLAVSQCSLTFGHPGFSIFATNGVVLDGAATKLGLWNLSSLGDCLVTNGATLRLYAVPTNGSLPEAGALVELGGALTIGPGSWIKPTSNPTNGGSVRFKVGSLGVSTNAGIDASGKGFQGLAGPGYGRTGNNVYGGGGAYGGLGGTGNSVGANSGVIYGWPAVPELPGSGGGNNFAGYGGGLVWIETPGHVTLDGTLAADGSRSWEHAGGGSGGGVLLACKSLTLGPASAITARGGSAGNPAGGGGGGGGRVAVWLKMSETKRANLLADPAGAEGMRGIVISQAYEGIESQISVTNGLGYTPAEMGTVRILTRDPTLGSLILIQ